MSITTELARIQANRNTIRAKLVELGMATSVDNLDVLAAAIDDLVNRGAVSVEIKEGTSYTIPAGYHNGSGTVKAVSDSAGDAEAYKTQAKTVTPTKKQQSVTPDSGYYALESVTVQPIPDMYQDVSAVTATPADTLTGKLIVLKDGSLVPGTMPDNGTVNKVLDATTVSYTIPAGKHSGSGKVTITLETKTVTPTKETQNITSTAGKVLNKVTVDPIPEKYVDNSTVTATDEKVLDGEKYGANGEVRTGSMPNNGETGGSIDGLTTTSVTIPAGYTSGGEVSLTNDIENALAAI